MPWTESQVAAIEGLEARYAFQKLGRGGLVIRAPNADLGRDPRWGRTEETIAEDPYLVATVGTSYVRGLEGAGVVAPLKHFAGLASFWPQTDSCAIEPMTSSGASGDAPTPS